MGLNKLGKVIKGYIANVAGSGLLSQWVSIEELKGFQQKAQVFGGVNEDASPPVGTQTVDIPIGTDRGFLASVAYRNQKITPIALAGEKRTYSTNAEGDTVMSEVFLHADGQVEVKNANGSVVLDPDGAITLTNGAETTLITLSALGAVTLFKAPSSFFEIGADEDISMGAPAIEFNGATYNLTMWEDLNTQLQAFITAYNAHVHVVAGVPPIVPQTLNITGARATTLKTDG